MKKYRFVFLVFLIPVVVYWWVLAGWSVGEDCVGGVNGNVTAIKNYFYCQQQIDTGAYSWQHLPHWHLVAHDWLSGVIPLWNPHQGIGVPLAANFISGAFNPLVVLANLSGSLLLVHWYLVLRLSLAAVGIYLCLRQFKFEKWPALTGATLFVFSGYFTQYFSMNHHDVDFVLPWLVWASLKAKSNNSYWGLSVLLVALSIFGGMPESTVFVLSIWGLICLWQGWTLPRERIKYYFFFFLSALSGIALAAILLLPGLEYINLSANSRVIGLGDVFATSPKNILFWILPKIFGPFYNILSRAPNLDILNINYFGLVGTLLVVTGLVTGGITFPGVLLLIMLAQYFGLLHLPLDRLPVFKDTIYIKYSLGAINFLAAYQLAKGFTALQDKKTNRKKIYTIVAAMLIVSLFFVGRDLAAVIGNAPLWKAKATLVFFVGQLFLGAVLFTLVSRNHSPKILALLVVLELSLYTPWFGDRTLRMQINQPEFVSWLKVQRDSGRIFSPDGILYPDYASYFGLDDIRDLDALWPANYYQYVRNYIQPDLDLAWLRFTGEKDNPNQRPAKYLDNPYFDRLAVRYIVTRQEINSSQLKLVYDKEVRIYENLHALPRVSFVNGEGNISNIWSAENSFGFSYTANADGYIVVANNFYPGWVATANGVGIKIDEVDGVFMGLAVPAHQDGRVRLSYSPPSFRAGLVISFAGLVSAVLLILFGQRIKPPHHG